MIVGLICEYSDETKVKSIAELFNVQMRRLRGVITTKELFHWLVPTVMRKR
jgi:hypothetical protein